MSNFTTLSSLGAEGSKAYEEKPVGRLMKVVSEQFYLTVIFLGEKNAEFNGLLKN